MSKMEEEVCEHKVMKAEARKSLEIKLQICGRKYQCEVKPVPTELEYMEEEHVTSAAQRETIQLTDPTTKCIPMQKHTPEVCYQLLPFWLFTREETEET